MIDVHEIIHLLNSNRSTRLKTLHAISTSLYLTEIHTNAIDVNELPSPSLLTLWHNRLGHPDSSMFGRIHRNVRGLPKSLPVTPPPNACVPCSLGKLVAQPSKTKVTLEEPPFLGRLHGDVCGPITLAFGPF